MNVEIGLKKIESLELDKKNLLVKLMMKFLMMKFLKMSQAVTRMETLLLSLLLL